MTPPPRHDGAEVCIHGHPWTVGNIYVRLLAELEKCDVLCANCHRVRTYSGANLHPAHAFRRRTA